MYDLLSGINAYLTNINHPELASQKPDFYNIYLIASTEKTVQDVMYSKSLIPHVATTPSKNQNTNPADPLQPIDPTHLIDTAHPAQLPEILDITNINNVNSDPNIDKDNYIFFNNYDFNNIYYHAGYGQRLSNACFIAAKIAGISFNGIPNNIDAINQRLVDGFYDIIQSTGATNTCSSEETQFLTNCYAYLKGYAFNHKNVFHDIPNNTTQNDVNTLVNELYYNPENINVSPNDLTYYSGEDSGMVAIYSTSIQNSLYQDGDFYVHGFIKLQGFYNENDTFEPSLRYYNSEDSNCGYSYVDTYLDSDGLSRMSTIINQWVLYQNLYFVEGQTASDFYQRAICTDNPFVYATLPDGHNLWIHGDTISY